ncbi:hypothetical protein JCM16163A_35170 [Paenibacillus sp. YK5]|nr:hypothetical protein PN4B1_17340 [Paenibacillus naphthalenovorans]
MVYIHWYSFGISRTGDDLNHAESDQKKGGVRQKRGRACARSDPIG